MNRRNFLKTISIFLASQSIFTTFSNSCTASNQVPRPTGLNNPIPRSGKKKKFKLYDQLHFKDQPPLTNAGLTAISVIYADQMWPDRIKKDNLDKDFLLRTYSAKPLLGDGEYLCLDIEHWPLRRVDEKTFNQSMDRYLETISVFRNIYPLAKIGLFEFAPVSFYPLYHQFAEGRIDEKHYMEWENEIRKIKPITDQVDVFFPQLYSRWPGNPYGWERCAREVIKKTREIAGTRPIIPFIWPQFWAEGEPLIPGEYWRRILFITYDIADSAVIWSIYRTAPNWSNSFEWWKETLNFLDWLN